MDRVNLEKYYLSMYVVRKMLDEGIITDADYQKSEAFIADKYCIKKGNLYRLINLTIPRNRAIYMIPEEEVNDEENNHQARCITQVSKEN